MYLHVNGMPPKLARVMPVTLAHVAQTYVVITNVQSACTYSQGIHAPPRHGLLTLYCTAKMKQVEHLPAQSSLKTIKEPLHTIVLHPFDLGNIIARYILGRWSRQNRQSLLKAQFFCLRLVLVCRILG